MLLSWSSLERFRQRFPTAVERVGLLSSLYEVGASSCLPLLAQLEPPMTVDAESALFLYLHRLMHELPAFVDVFVAATVESASHLILYYHVPRAQVMHRSVFNAEYNWPLPRSGFPIPLNYSLNPISLQQRHVRSAIASMSVGGRPSPMVDEVEEESNQWTQLSLSCLVEEPLCDYCNSSALLLSTHNLHITGEFIILSPGRFLLHSLSILSGPLQQAIVFHRDGVAPPSVTVDSSPMRSQTVWPLLNYGNLTVAQENRNGQLWWTAEMRLAWNYNAPKPTFAYKLRISGQIRAEGPYGLCETMTINSLSIDERGPAIGAFVQGWQPVQQMESDHGASQLHFRSYEIQGPSLYAYPLLRNSELPLISVSFQSLPPGSPAYLIPRVIQTNWFGPLTPPWLWLNSWRRDYLHRYPGWVHLLWGEESVQHLPYLDHWLWDIEVKRKSYNGLSDASRVAMVRSYGGVFLDADSASLDGRPLDELWQAANSSGFFIAREKVGSPYYAAGVFGSVSSHPILQYFQHFQHANTERNQQQGEAERIGPGASTPAVQRCDQAVQCEFTEVQPVKFFPVFWLGLGHNTLTVNASLYPDALMYQFGYSSNEFDKKQEVELAKGRRRNRRLR
jgi:hypothetical protein